MRSLEGDTGDSYTTGSVKMTRQNAVDTTTIVVFMALPHFIVLSRPVHVPLVY